MWAAKMSKTSRRSLTLPELKFVISEYLAIDNDELLFDYEKGKEKTTVWYK